VPELAPEEIHRFKQAWKTSQVRHVVAHIPFLVNLASPDKEIRRKSESRLAIDLIRAREFGIPSLVLHVGSHRGSGEVSGITRVIESLSAILDDLGDSDTKILLETAAGQGTALGYRFETLAYVLEMVEGSSRLGICFDTCHVFAAGYDIRSYSGYETVLREVDSVIGIDRIKAFHLNDSRAGLGSRIDRHASIGEGRLGLEVFHALVKDPRFLNIPKILEIPKRDERSQQDLDLLRRLQVSPCPASYT
jgi:deoxyribonuclease-4